MRGSCIVGCVPTVLAQCLRAGWRCNDLAEAAIDLTPLSRLQKHAPGLLIDYFERRASHFT